MELLTFLIAFLIPNHCTFAQTTWQVESPCATPIFRKSFETLLRTLDSGSEAFDVIFFDLKIDKCSLSLQNSPSMLFNSYPNHIDHQFPTKYHQPSHLAVANLSAHKYPEFIVMLQSTLLLYPFTDPPNGRAQMVNANKQFPVYMRNYPAVMLVLVVTSVSSRLKVFYSFICNRYCISTKSNGETNSEFYNSLRKPTHLHRMLYRNGNKRKIDVQVTASRSGQLLATCSNKLRTPSRYHKCSKQFMVLVEIFGRHNYSRNLNLWRYKGEKRVDKSKGNQYVHLMTSYINYSGLRWKLSGLQFFKNFGRKFVYCTFSSKTDANYSIDFSTWINAFSLEIWSVTIITFSVLMAIQQLVKSPRYTDIMQESSRDYFKLSMCLYPISLICSTCTDLLDMFVVQEFYGNEVLSVLAVPDPPKTYETLKEMLSLGYKILWPSFTGLPYPVLQDNFKRWGMLDTLNSSFYIYNESTGLTSASFLHKKFVVTVNSEYTIANLIYKNTLRKQEIYKHTECYMLPELVNERSWFLEVYAVNRFWMLETYSRIVQSGLVGKWEAWQEKALEYFYKVFEKPNYNVAVKTGDEIQLDSILAVLIAAGCVCLFCVLCLLMEVLVKRHANSRHAVKNLEQIMSPKTISRKSLDILDDNICCSTRESNPMDSNDKGNGNPEPEIMSGNGSSDSFTEAIYCSSTQSKPEDSTLVLVDLLLVDLDTVSMKS